MAFTVAVFDTNILVRMALHRSVAIERLWEAYRAERFELVLSNSILEELDRVLHYPRITKRHRLNDKQIKQIRADLKARALMVHDLYEVEKVEQDPDDNIFLACALEAYADYLVSEDNHLRAIKYYHGVQIVGLAQFQKEIGL